MVAGAVITAYSYQIAFGGIGIAMIIISLAYGLGMRRIAVRPAAA
jgi:hypothetical protein